MLQVLNATDVRKDWSSVVDSAIRVKPQFFKRTRDYLFLSDLHFMEELLAGYSYSAIRMEEETDLLLLPLMNWILLRTARMKTMPELSLQPQSWNMPKTTIMISPIGEAHRIADHISHMYLRRFSSEMFRRLEIISDAKLERSETIL